MANSNEEMTVQRFREIASRQVLIRAEIQHHPHDYGNESLRGRTSLFVGMFAVPRKYPGADIYYVHTRLIDPWRPDDEASVWATMLLGDKGVQSQIDLLGVTTSGGTKSLWSKAAPAVITRVDTKDEVCPATPLMIFYLGRVQERMALLLSQESSVMKGTALRTITERLQEYINSLREQHRRVGTVI
jgi:hypothetical protein